MRQEQILISVPPTAKQEWTQAAAAEGISLAGYIKRRVEDAHANREGREPDYASMGRAYRRHRSPLN